MGLSGTYTGSASQNTNMINWMRTHGYKKGVYDLSEDQLAWTQEGGGMEAIIRPSDGAILTPLAKNDSVLNAGATANLYDFTNNPSKFMRDNLDITSTTLPQSMGSSSINNDVKLNLTLPNVKNYEQFKEAMRRDPSIEKMIQSMTIDKIAGRSSLRKYKC